MNNISIKTTFPLFTIYADKLELSLITDEKDSCITLTGATYCRVHLNMEQAEMLYNQLRNALEHNQSQTKLYRELISSYEGQE